MIQENISQETIQVSIKKEEISADELVFAVTRDLQGLDIIMSLQMVGCYSFPSISVLQNINGEKLLNKLSKKDLMFDEIIFERKYKKSFGFYGFKVLKLFKNFLQLYTD